MYDGGLMYQALIFLLAAVISVPIAKKMGLGSVLGYLLAGVAIGPYVLALVGEDISSIMHFAEFGVVMMLFLVGLDLQPKLFWKMRKPILGLGGLQVVLTSAVFYLIALALGFSWQTALAIGLILCMSSTALVLQSLNEKGLLASEAGQSAFAVLLFQDIAVIPMLALLPLLAMDLPGDVGNATSVTNVLGLKGWQYGLLVIAVVIAIIGVGHYLLRPLFRVIAQTKLREIFTATALALVIGIAMLMEAVGLSAALGTFIAGVVLADSEYRHELEAEIEPFKGLLLGVFFISVGASIDFTIVAEQPGMIAQLLLLLVVVKVLVLYGLAKAFKLQRQSQSTFSYTLAQGGEFCFVLFTFADQNRVLPVEVTQPLVVVVALSMACTPLLMIFNDKVVQPKVTTNKANTKRRQADRVENEQPQVIIAGFGRFGQIVDRSLILSGVKTTVMESDAAQVEQLRKFGHQVYYGDLSRLDLLYAAGAAKATLLVVAVSDHEKAKTIIEVCQKHFPGLKIFARATGRVEAYELNKMGVDVFVRETFHSALYMSERVLSTLGTSVNDAQRILTTFKEFDEMHVRDMLDFDGDERAYISFSQQNKAELARVLRFDFDDLAKVNEQNAELRD